MEIIRGALSVAWLPFSWSADAFRRSRGAIANPAHLAERAKFNTRTWSPELLKHLDWRRFEELCAAYFEDALGLAIQVTQSRAGAAVDIALFEEGTQRDGAEKPTLLVHCKPWDAYRVGVKPLRELRAAMTAASARKGMLITAGRFTHEALPFAKKEGIDLVDGASLLAKFRELPPEKALALLKLATQGDFLTPTCPACSIKMASKKSTQGGRTFWGCTNYPRCKQTFSGTIPA